MDIYAQMVQEIIKQQEMIIGPVALEQAEHVEGLKLNWKKKEIAFTGEKKEVLNRLVQQYKDFFGQVSVEVCRDAVRHLPEKLPTDQLPDVLR